MNLQDMIKSAHVSSMVYYKTRLQTFVNWPLMNPKPTNLAKAGFFHRRSDLVMCFYCGLCMHQWLSSDDPVLEHAPCSPNCRYIIYLLGHQLHSEIIAGFNKK